MSPIPLLLHYAATDSPAASKHNDSVLHYFVVCDENEVLLDSYFNSIIKAFLKDPSTIYATNTDTKSQINTNFGNSAVPSDGAKVDKDGHPDLDSYLEHIKATVIDRATRVSSAKMIGHMTTALPYFHRPLARLLAALNQNVVKLETSSTMTFLERETGAMLHRSFYDRPESFYANHLQSVLSSASSSNSLVLDPGTLSIFCSGGTIANITAMWVARNNELGPFERLVEGGGGIKEFGGVEKEGLFRALNVYGYTGGAVIIGSRFLHYSFKKAADLLGLGDSGLVLIDTDSNFRIRTDLVEKKVAEFKSTNTLVLAIIGIVGTTETGAIDNLDELSRIATKNQIHFHVDAAWGGPLIFSPSHSHKLSGIANASTITVDGHKQLYTPLGLGVLLFQRPTLPQRIRKTANYIIRAGSVDLGKYSIEGSRPANCLHLHASLSILGKSGLNSLITRSVTLVKQLWRRLSDLDGFEVCHEPMSNILVYRYIPRRLRGKSERIKEEKSEFDKRVDGGVDKNKRRWSSGKIANGSESIDVMIDEDGSKVRSVRRFSITNVDENIVPSVNLKTDGEQSRDLEYAANWNEEEDKLISELTREIQKMQSVEGTLGFVSRTTIGVMRRVEDDSKMVLRDVDVFRVVIANPLTKWEDVEDVINEQVKFGRVVEEKYWKESVSQVKVDKSDQSEDEKVSKFMEKLDKIRSRSGKWAGWPMEL
ncbi:hypothetical protein HK098_000493 [Nowakowskiella sp. JEL0407]|nr:hypothetical protein HK098_000493 [Nowakowskiella sp. JEL0407]